MDSGLKTSATLFFLSSALLWSALTGLNGLLVPYLVNDKGLSLASALGLFSIMHWAIICLEVPTGVVADRLGRVVSALIGMLLMAASFLVFVPLSAYLSVTAATVLLLAGVAVSWSLYSGSFKGEVLNVINKTSPGMITWFNAKSAFYNNISILGSTLLFPYVFQASGAYFWLLPSLMCFLSAAAIFSYHRFHRRYEQPDNAKAPTETTSEAVAWTAVLSQNASLVFLLISTYAFASFFQVNINTEVIRLKEGAELGLWYMMFLQSSWASYTVGSTLASPVVAKTRFLEGRAKASLMLMILVAGFALYAGATAETSVLLFPVLAFLCGLLINILRIQFTSVFQTRIGVRSNISTILSSLSLLEDLACALLLAGSSFMLSGQVQLGMDLPDIWIIYVSAIAASLVLVHMAATLKENVRGHHHFSEGGK